MLNRKENALFNNLSITQKAFHRKLTYNFDFGFTNFHFKDRNCFIIQISETLSKLTDYFIMNIGKKIHKEFIKYF